MSDITQEQINVAYRHALVRMKGLALAIRQDAIEESVRIIEQELTERQQHIKRIEELEGALRDVCFCYRGILQEYKPESLPNAWSLIKAEKALSTNEDKGKDDE